MFDTILSPQAIAFFSSLVPVGAWLAESSGAAAQSIVVSETTNIFKNFIRDHLLWKHVGDCYNNAVKETLADKSLTIDDETRSALKKTQERFDNFSRFVDAYNDLNTLTVSKRRKEAKELFRNYVKKHVPSISPEVLVSLETRFSKEAFAEIDRCIRKSPEIFYSEAMDSLTRIEEELAAYAKDRQDLKENLEILQSTARYYQSFTPQIKGFGEYLQRNSDQLNKISSELQEVRRTQEEHSTQHKDQSVAIGQVKDGIDTIIKKIDDIPLSDPTVSSSPEQNSRKIEGWFTLAETEFASGNAEKANSFLEKILEVDPNNYRAHFERGKCSSMACSATDFKFSELLQGYTVAKQLIPPGKREEFDRSAIDFLYTHAGKCERKMEEKYVYGVDEKDLGGYVERYFQILDFYKEITTINPADRRSSKKIIEIVQSLKSGVKGKGLKYNAKCELIRDWKYILPDNVLSRLSVYERNF